MQLNKKILNIRQMQMLLLGFGAKIADRVTEKGSPKKCFGKPNIRKNYRLKD